MTNIEWYQQVNQNFGTLHGDLSNEEDLKRVMLFNETTREFYSLYDLSYGPDVSFSDLKHENQAQILMNKMAQYQHVYMFDLASDTPVELKKDGELHEVPEVLMTRPNPPQRPSRWHRFANWITNGKAYFQEMSNYSDAMSIYNLEIRDYDAMQSCICVRSVTLDEEAVRLERIQQGRQNPAADVSKREAGMYSTPISVNELSGSKDLGKTQRSAAVSTEKKFEKE